MMADDSDNVITKKEQIILEQKIEEWHLVNDKIKDIDKRYDNCIIIVVTILSLIITAITTNIVNTSLSFQC